MSPEEAKAIRQWAMEAGRNELADRFYRVERAAAGNRPMVEWGRKSQRPILLQCVRCQEWEAFKRHRHARSAWTRTSGTWGAWIHRDCVQDWQENGAELTRTRAQIHERRTQHEYLFGEPNLLESYRGVLLRWAPYQEHTFFGVLDDMEAQIQADLGMERVRNLVDEMPPRLRDRLVGAAFTGYHFGYHVLFAWADAVPAEYDDTEEGDVRHRSFLVDELSRQLRNRLPEHLRGSL